jgi:hypothetical protein
MPAPGALGADEIAGAKILDASGVEGYHWAAPSCWFVLALGTPLIGGVNVHGDDGDRR